MSLNAVHISWDAEIAELLDELSSVQHDLLDVLTAKRDCMARNDLDGMTELQPQAEMLCDRLRACHDRREELLTAAREQGLPGESLGQLASALPLAQRVGVQRPLQEAKSRMRLLQHHSLANWVLAQRTMLHLSQLLEIIATGGRLQPTYSRDEASSSRGVLVDKEV